MCGQRLGAAKEGVLKFGKMEETKRNYNSQGQTNINRNSQMRNYSTQYKSTSIGKCT